MERATLQATKRAELGTRAVRRLRRQGVLPAVLYGHQRDTVSLSVPLRDFEHLVHDGARLMDIEIGGTVEPAVIKDIQYDAMGDHILHVDFARVAMDEKITLTVPVRLHGVPKGVNEGGLLDQPLVDLEVSCLPGDIPEEILIEIAHLEIGDTVHVGDLTPPPGVEFVEDSEAPILSVRPPQEVEEPEAEEAAIEAVGAEPEVIGRGAEGEQEGPDEG
jgi:large subunit ribosomal protein L25